MVLDIACLQTRFLSRLIPAFGVSLTDGGCQSTTGTKRDKSIVYERVPGFERIPFEKIGLYQDEYRATWPASGDEP
jgi:hypothetical protein